MKRWILLASALLAFTAACGSGSVDPKQQGPASSSQRLQPSSVGGMGAVLYNGGVSFRVYAPNAVRAFVIGDFNGWNEGANEMGNEFNGNFSTQVAGAQRWQKYKYVFYTSWGDKVTRADPRSQRVENSSGASIIHDPGAYSWTSGFGTPSFNDMVVYEMHIGTFNDSPGFGPGNWRSAAARLDHLQSLGVNMLEVMPPAEFPGDFSWGYNPSFPYAPESAYGTPEDAKYFIDQAHARGMGVIIDVVHNHYGPSDLPMWCIDGSCLGNGGVYFYTDWRKSTPWGDTRPDYGRHEVRDYIKDNAMMWLNEYRADGLRWDAVKYIRTVNGDGTGDLPDGWSLMQWINDSIDQSQPWKINIAEDFGAEDAVTRGTGAGGMGFDTQWDAHFVHPVRDAVITQNDSDRDMYAVRDAITHSYNGQASQRVIYTESHDEVANGQARVPEMIWPGNAGSWFSKKRSTLAAAVVMTSPGIPMIFEGQEFLTPGYFQAESPLDWSLSSTYGGIISLYRDLIHLRRNWFNNTRGLRGDHVNVFHVNNSDKVIAYHRWNQGGPGDDVVVVANFSGTSFQHYTIGMPRGGTWYVRFNSDSSNYSGDFGNFPSYDTNAVGASMDGLGYKADVGLPPYSVIILSQ